MGETTLDIGPGSLIWTPATGRVGVAVIVGVCVARRLGVTLWVMVLVALGRDVRVGEGLYAREVALG